MNIKCFVLLCVVLNISNVWCHISEAEQNRFMADMRKSDADNASVAVIPLHRDQDTTVYAPYFFSYKINSDLNIKSIYVTNISKDITEIKLLEAENCLPEKYNLDIDEDYDWNKCNVKNIGLGPISDQSWQYDIFIKLQSSKSTIWYFTEFKKGDKSLYNKTVFAGNTKNTNPYKDSNKCLDKSSACKFFMDFNKKIYELRSVGDSINFTCNPNPKTPNSQLFQTYNGYEDKKDLIAYTPKLKSKIRLDFKVESFDNTTKVYCHGKHVDDIWIKPTNETNSIISDYTNTHNYSSAEPVPFDCQTYEGELSYVHVGIIDTTNRIQIYNQTEISETFTDYYNGAVLCCVYYVVENKTDETVITRFVANKTSLIYFEDVDSQALVSRNTITYSVVGVVLLIILITIIVFSIKYYNNKTSSQKGLELQTYATTNRVMYADLAELRQTGRRPQHTEESPYAQIIGVMKPP